MSHPSLDTRSCVYTKTTHSGHKPLTDLLDLAGGRLFLVLPGRYDGAQYRKHCPGKFSRAPQGATGRNTSNQCYQEDRQGVNFILCDWFFATRGVHIGNFPKNGFLILVAPLWGNQSGFAFPIHCFGTGARGLFSRCPTSSYM